MVKRKRARAGAEQEAQPAGEIEITLESDDSGEPAGQSCRPAADTDRAEEKNLVQEYLDHLQRVQAEFANYRKRVQRELSESYDYGKTELICRLLPVVDDLERALENLGPGCDDDEALKGVKLIYDKLRSTLQGEGLEQIECKGEMFDPNLHEAVMVTRSDEGCDGEIVRDLSKGYRFKGKVIRPSRVEVRQIRADSGDE
ncbi:MAG: nucleotide exchange factor GrpE [Candidatus Eisenbacteria bacterium]